MLLNRKQALKANKNALYLRQIEQNPNLLPCEIIQFLYY